MDGLVLNALNAPVLSASGSTESRSRSVTSNDDTCSFATDGSAAETTAFARKIASAPSKSAYGSGARSGQSGNSLTGFRTSSAGET